jgi:hypothetical protein
MEAEVSRCNKLPTSSSPSPSSSAGDHPNVGGIGTLPDCVASTPSSDGKTEEQCKNAGKDLRQQMSSACSSAGKTVATTQDACHCYGLESDGGIVWFDEYKDLNKFKSACGIR